VRSRGSGDRVDGIVVDTGRERGIELFGFAERNSSSLPRSWARRNPRITVGPRAPARVDVPRSGDLDGVAVAVILGDDGFGEAR